MVFSNEKLDSVVKAIDLWSKNRGPDESIYFVITRIPPEFQVFIIFNLFF